MNMDNSPGASWWVCACALAAFACSVNFASAQESSPAPTGKPSPVPSPKVTAVAGKIALHKQLAVTCDGLKEWAKDKDADALILYLDGNAMKGLAPKVDQLSANMVFFKLERISGDDASKDDNHKA